MNRREDNQNRFYRAIEYFDIETENMSTEAFTVINTTPIENRRLHDDPVYHPYDENTSFVMTDSTGRQLARVITPSKRGKIGPWGCGCKTRQLQYIKSVIEPDHEFGQIKGEKWFCFLPEYTVTRNMNKTNLIESYGAIRAEIKPFWKEKYKLRPRWWSNLFFCPLSYGIFDIDLIKDGDKCHRCFGSGHVTRTEVKFPSDALEDNKILILGAQVLINKNSIC